MGSRSMRAGISWLVLGVLCIDGTETLMDCLESTGVERLMDGRLRAAGLMSTMVGELAAVYGRPRISERYGQRCAKERASGPSRTGCSTILGRTRVHLCIKMEDGLMRSRFRIQIDGSGMVALSNG
jgi:hypothetical protein